jgi:hypothetical protein
MFNPAFRIRVICVICGQMPFFPNLLRCDSLDNSQRENLVGIA